MPKSLYIDPVKVREPGYIHFEDIPVCQYNKTIKQELDEGNYTKEDLIRIYRDMAICREFEHMLTLIKTQANYNGVETTYPGPAHLSYGQEASCVGEAYLLNKDDITFGSHRSHSEILSKGLSCINKLSDEELMQTMESFLGGKTALTAGHHGDPFCTVSRFFVENFPQRNTAALVKEEHEVIVLEAVAHGVKIQ